jgi:hypothetical protein
MSDSGNRRSRRAKAKVVNYSKEQEFSDADDIFEDSDKEEPTPKRGRPRSRKSNASDGVVMVNTGELNDSRVYTPSKPIYTERGYGLLPIRERFPFLPEYELDGSPRIDLIVGRRPVDEKESNDNNDTDEENESAGENEDYLDAEVDRRSSRRRTKNKGSPRKEKSVVMEYEYLVKYKNRSYLHLEWKTGADLESMNKSAKAIYRRYLRKVEAGNDDELEDPNFDPSYALPQKIVAQEEQEITLELSDKELIEWEKEREKELAEEEDSVSEEKTNGEAALSEAADATEKRKDEGRLF